MNRILTIVIFLLSTEASCQLSNPDKDSAGINYLYDKAIDHENLNHLDSALECYLKILKLVPNYRPALNGAGSMFGETGNYDKAFQYFSKSRSADRSDVLPLSNFCYYKSLAGNYHEAILYGDTALAIANDSIQIGVIMNNRGYAHLKLGNIEKASLDIKKSLNYLPGNPYAHRNRALLYIAEKKFNEACQALNEAKKLGGTAIVKEMILRFCN